LIARSLFPTVPEAGRPDCCLLESIDEYSTLAADKILKHKRLNLAIPLNLSLANTVLP